MHTTNHSGALDRLRLSSLVSIALMLYLSTHGYIPFLMSVQQSPADAEGAVGLAAQALFLVVVLFLALPYTTKIIRSARVAWPLLALALLAVCSSAWSQDPSVSLRRSVMLLGPTLFALFLHATYRPRQQMELFLITGLAAAILTIIMVVRFPGVGHDPTMADGAWQGIFPQKNVCARAFVFSLLPAVAWLGRSAKKTLIALFAMLLFAVVLVGTHSSTGWILAGVAVAATLSMRWFRRLPANESIVLAVIVVGGAIAGLLLLEERVTIVLELLGKDSTLTGRTVIWTAALEAITKHPFLGYGYSAFWLGLKGESANIVLAARWVVPAAHNGFLDVWLQLGGVGLGLFLISLVQASRAAMWCLRNIGREAVEWCAGIILLTVLYNLDETSLMIPRELLWVLYSLAFVNLRSMMFEQKAHMSEQQIQVVMTLEGEPDLAISVNR